MGFDQDIPAAVWPDNLRVGGEGAHFDVTLSFSLDAQKKCLADQFVCALAISPMAHVRTPGWGYQRNHASVLDVISDDFASPTDTSLRELLEIVSEQAKAGNERAQRWIKRAAERYADFHAGE
jgi:hypothetical protein